VWVPAQLHWLRTGLACTRLLWRDADGFPRVWRRQSAGAALPPGFGSARHDSGPLGPTRLCSTRIAPGPYPAPTSTTERVRKRHPRMFYSCLTHRALIRGKDRIPSGWCFWTHPRRGIMSLSLMRAPCVRQRENILGCRFRTLPWWWKGRFHTPRFQRSRRALDRTTDQRGTSLIRDRTKVPTPALTNRPAVCDRARESLRKRNVLSFLPKFVRRVFGAVRYRKKYRFSSHK